MKIAFATGKVNQDHRIGPHEFNVSEKRPPNGIGYMTGILERAGHEVKIMDRYCGDESYQGDYGEFDLLGIYCTTICMDDVKETIQRARAKRIAVGGPHWSIFPADGATKHQPAEWREKIDYIVVGEGEQVIERIAEGATFVGKMVHTPRLESKDLDRLPRFPWARFYHGAKQHYHWGFPFGNTAPVFTMNTSRGCPYGCSFCSTKKIWGRKITMMSAERIMADIAYLDGLGARGIYFREDNFTIDRSRVLDFCDLMRHANLSIEWACETRVDTVDRDTMSQMADAGCRGFYVGVEHGSQRILDKLNKGITVDQIVTFFDNARELGIRTAASMIISHPDETEADKKAFWDLLNRIKPTMQWHNHYRKDG